MPMDPATKEAFEAFRTAADEFIAQAANELLKELEQPDEHGAVS